jgi:hypothetical protein
MEVHADERLGRLNRFGLDRSDVRTRSLRVRFAGDGSSDNGRYGLEESASRFWLHGEAILMGHYVKWGNEPTGP